MNKRKLLAIILSICMVFVFCSCAESSSETTSEGFKVKDITLSLSDDWVVEDILTYANSIEDEDADYAEYLKSQTDEDCDEQYVVNNDDLPEWLFLYIIDTSSGEYCDNIDDIKANWTDGESDISKIDETEVCGIRALEVAENTETKSGETAESSHIYFILNNYQYEFSYINLDNDMDEYVDEVLNSISINEDEDTDAVEKTNTVSFGDLSWEVSGEWEKVSNEEPLSDVDILVDEIEMDSTDNTSLYIVDEYEGANYFDVDGYAKNLEESDNVADFSSKEYETDNVNFSKIATYSIVLSEEGGTMYQNLLGFAYKDNTYIINVMSKDKDKSAKIAKEIRESLQ